MTSSINPTSVYPTYGQFVAALMQALDRFNRNGKDYLGYLSSPHPDDELDMRVSLGFAIFEALGWQFSSTGNDIIHDATGAAGSRPDIIVKLPAANRAAFVIETKSTNETRIDDGDPYFKQLAGYIENNGITLGILTNHVRVNAWQFRPEGHTPISSFDLREIYGQYKTGGIDSLTPAQEQELRRFWQTFRKEVFAGLDAVRAGIYANPYRPVNVPAHEAALTQSLTALTEQLRSDALSQFNRLDNAYQEYEQAHRYLDDAQTQPAESMLANYRQRAIDQLQASFRIATAAADAGAVLSNFEQNYRNHADIVALRNEMWEASHPNAPRNANPDDTGLDESLKYARIFLDYQRRIRRLDNTYREARAFRANFYYWRDVNESPTASASDFCLQTIYVQLVRLLLVRICEDKGLLKRMISDGGFAEFDSSFKVRFFQYIKDAYNQLLNLVYLNTRNIYAHFFDKSDLFDWYQADENILLEAFATLNQFNFAEVNSDIIGVVYERYLESERKLTGQYYTPTVVVEYIMDTLGYSGQSIIGTSLIDLACGSGKFLVTAANRLVNAYRASGQYPPDEIIKEVTDHIFGFDLNPFACYLAEINMLVQLVDLVKEVRTSQPNFAIGRFRVYRTNSLFLPRNGNGNGNGQMKFIDDLELEVSIADERKVINQIMTLNPQLIPGGGFDFVVGNPPYGAELDDYLTKYLNTNYYTAEGEYDTYAAFMERGLDMLKIGGKLGYITPNTWTTNKYYRKLRYLALTTTAIKDIVEAWEMFDQAKVNSLIFVLQKKVSKTGLFSDGISKQVLDDPSTGPDPQSATVEIYQLPEKFIRIPGTYQSPAVVRRRELLANRAWSAIRTAQQDDWWASDDFMFNLTLDPADAAIIQHVKQSSIPLKSIVDINLGVKAYQAGKGIPRQTEADVAAKRFHATAQLDNSYRPELLTDDIDRYYLHFGGRNWVRWGQNLAEPRDARFWSQPKLVVPKISGGMRERIRAAYDNQNYISPTNFSALIQTNPSYNLKYLLVLLNSRLFNWYFEHVYQDKNVKVYHLNALPIKPLDAAGQQPFIDVADNLITLNNEIAAYRDAGYRIDVESGEVIPPISQLLKPLGANVTDLRRAAATSAISVIPGTRAIRYPLKRVAGPVSGQSKLLLRQASGEVSITGDDQIIDYLEVVFNELREQLEGKTWAQLAPQVPFPSDEATAHTGLNMAQARIAEVSAKLAEIRNLDQQANNMVYQLYGLDVSEIAIVSA